jgi:hypothetical protein
MEPSSTCGSPMYKMTDGKLTLHKRTIKEIGVLFDSDAGLSVLLKHGEYNEVFDYYRKLIHCLAKDQSYYFLFNLKMMRVPKDKYEKVNEIIRCSAAEKLSELYKEINNDKLLN